MVDTARATSESTTETTGVVRATYDWTSTAPSTGVIETVADATDREPLALDPLYHSVDTDALDRLVVSSQKETTVTFSYAGRDVTVHSDGTVAVLPDASYWNQEQ